MIRTLQKAIEPTPQMTSATASRPNMASRLGIAVAICAFASITGAAVGLFGTNGALAAAAVIIFFATLWVPVTAFFVAILIITFVVTGQLQYFGGIDKAYWVPYLLGAVLVVKLLAKPARLKRRTATTGDDLSQQTSASTPPIFLLFLLFFATLIASSLINRIEPLQWLIAGKEYFFLVGIFFAIASAAISTDKIKAITNWIPWFLALQMPAVIYQRFVIAANRTGDSPWDAVVGLFGGDPQSGGASGTMALFSLVSIAVALEARKAGTFTLRRTALTIVLALAACALAEVKMIIVLLPVTVLLTFSNKILRKPVQGLVILALTGTMAAGILALYQLQFTSTATRAGTSLSDYVDNIIQSNSSTKIASVGLPEMGRISSLVYWWNAQDASNPAAALIGHGIGSSRLGTLYVGAMVKQHHLRLARSTLTALLWESGIIGATSLVVAILICALRLRRQPSGTIEAKGEWLNKAAGTTLLLILLTLPYGLDLIEVSQLQIVLLIMLGLAAKQYLPAGKAATSQHARPAPGKPNAFSSHA